MDDPGSVPHTIWDDLKLRVVSDVDDYRALAAELSERVAVVIELGAATGETTAILAARAMRVVAIEKGRERAEMLRGRFRGRENVIVVCADAAELDAVQGAVERADLLFADLGGDAPAWPTMSIVEEHVAAFRPAAVVVRNTELAGFLRAAAPPVDAIDQPAALDGLASDEKHAARRAASAIARLATADAAARLAALLADADARTRRAASEGLRAVGAASLKPLADLLADQTVDARARRTAAALIRRIGSAATAELAAMARSPLPALQWAGAAALAADALGELTLESLAGAPGARLAFCEQANRLLPVPDIVALLVDADEVGEWALRRHLAKHRGRAARALGRFVLFSDGSAAEKAVALQALAALSPEQVETLPARAAGKRLGPALRCALWGLAAAAVALADEGHFEAILQAVQPVWERGPQPLEFVRRLWVRQPGDALSRDEVRDAARVCAKQDCPPTAPLLAGLRSPHACVREMCARAAGWLAVGEAQPEVKRLLQDPVPEVRRAARSALHALRPLVERGSDPPIRPLVEPPAA